MRSLIFFFFAYRLCRWFGHVPGRFEQFQPSYSAEPRNESARPLVDQLKAALLTGQPLFCTNLAPHPLAHVQCYSSAGKIEKMSNYNCLHKCDSY